MTAEAQTITELEEVIREKKALLAERYRNRPGDVVDDHHFSIPDGERTSLSALFAGRSDLIVVHNMGRDCPYCTMWADGFNGLLAHIEDRASFVVSSPDPPDVQQAFADERGWDFRMVSTADSSFTEAMGFADGEEYYPGVSTFRRDDDGTIRRIASREFGPFDDFCSAWNMFAILDEGVGEWGPAYEYA